MILLTALLLIVLIILAAIIAVAVAIGGGVTFFVCGDTILCIVAIAIIVKHMINKSQKD